MNVSVKGMQQLRLVMTDTCDGNGSDHGDWANAILFKSSEENTSSEEGR